MFFVKKILANPIKNLPSIISILFIAGSLFSLIGFWSGNSAQAADANDVGEITQGVQVIQTINASYNDLQQTSVRMGTWGRTNNCTVRFTLVEVDNNKTIGERYEFCKYIQDLKDYTITYPPVANSKGKQFQLIITSPDGTPGNAVTAITTSGTDLGPLTVSGKPYAGELLVNNVYRYGGYGNKIFQMVLGAVAFFVFLLLLLFGRWTLKYRQLYNVTTLPDLRKASPAIVRSFPGYLYNRRIELGIMTLVLFFYLSAIPQVGFSDEYDNIVGGLYLNEGKLLYKDYFTQHLPAPYFVVDFIMTFVGHNMWLIRAVFDCGLFLWSVANYLLIKKYSNKYAGLLFLVLFGCSMTIIWAHLILAETLVGYASVTLIILLFFKYANQYAIGWGDVVVFSLLNALIALSSLAYIFLLGLFYLCFAYYFLRQRYFSKLMRLNVFGAIGILAVPYLVVFLYLVVTGTFAGNTSTFMFQADTYNTLYYSQFVTNIQDSPLTDFIQVVQVAFDRLQAATQNVLTQDDYPFFLYLICVVTSTAYFVHAKKLLNACLVVIITILINPRVDVLGRWHNNFHITPYVMVSLLLGSVAAVEIATQVKARRSSIVLRGSWYLLSIFMLLSTLVALGFDTNIYLEYSTQNAGGALSRGPTDIATTINNLTTPQDKVWVGAWDMETQFYLKAQPATNIHYMAAWLVVCPECMQDFMSGLQHDQPKIIYYDSSPFLMDRYGVDNIAQYLKDNYFTVPQMPNYYFINTQKDSIMAQLQQKGYIPTQVAAK